jgi:DNA helicase-2/ATP-dependent DNA helicase PcrA
MPSPLDGLAAAQREAVTHPSGPLLVLGGAGTGKTRVLTRRFAWLVEEGTPADGVLSLVFSPAAAAEMRERVEDLTGSAGLDLWVETFHSFSTRLLQDEALEAGLDPHRPTGSP